MSTELLIDEIKAEFENHDAWAEAYEKMVAEPPAPGTILRTQSGKMAKLEVELTAGKPPFVYGKAHVPCIVDEAVAWYLYDMDTVGHGWKCILLPKSREELLRREGMKKLVIPVLGLKVVKHSASKKSVLCDILTE